MKTFNFGKAHKIRRYPARGGFPHLEGAGARVKLPPSRWGISMDLPLETREGEVIHWATLVVAPGRGGVPRNGVHSLGCTIAVTGSDVADFMVVALSDDRVVGKRQVVVGFGPDPKGGEPGPLLQLGEWVWVKDPCPA